jgi:nitrite reductase (NO-forming)
MKFIILLSTVLFVAFFASSFTQDTKQTSIKRGQEVYTNNCQTCHFENGEGVENTFPPLAKSDYLMKDPVRTIAIILKGQSEPIKVNGKDYNAIMPAQDYLTDEQIADVTNYISNSWGNSYKKLITPAMVKAAR